MEERLAFIQILSHRTCFNILKFFFDGKSEDAPSRQKILEIMDVHTSVIDAQLTKLRENKILESERSAGLNVVYRVHPEIEQWKFDVLNALFNCEKFPLVESELKW